MEINLNKSAKRALSLVLAIAVLIGSLFTANVGININASAATEATVDYDVWEGTADTEWEQDSDGTYLITSAEELYGMVLNDGKVNGTAESFKVADGITAFYLSDIKSLLDNNATDDEIYTAVQGSTNWLTNVNGQSWYDTTSETSASNVCNNGFEGTFDGNGVTIYGLNAQGTHNSAFIPYVSGDTTIKNVAFKYSYATTSSTSVAHYIAVVVAGGVNGKYTASTDFDANIYANVNFEKIYVEDAKISTANAVGGLGAIMPSMNYTTTTLTNCFVADMTYTGGITITTGASSNAGAFPIKSSKNTATVNYCVSINAGDSRQYGSYTGSYTTSTTDVSGMVKVSGGVTGAAAKTNMPALAWNDVWYIGEYGQYPQFTPISYDVWDGTADTYWEQDEDGKFIISTTAELYGMVKNEGKDADGNAASFKVADGVKEFYLSPIKGLVESGADADAIYTAVQTGTNWNQTSYSYATNVGFVGNFDGNGATIYGMYASAPGNKGGFIPSIVNENSTTTIENVAFKYSYLKSATNDPKQGVVVGMVGDTSETSANTGGNLDKDKILNFNKVRVEYAKFEFSTSQGHDGARAGLCARPHYADMYVNSCFVSDITTYTSGSAGNEKPLASGFADTSNAKLIVNDSVDLTTERQSLAGNYTNCTFTNSYSVMDTAANKLSSADLAKGAAAKTNMPALDWTDTWFTTSGYTEFKSFHNLTIKGDTTGHCYTCSDCGLVGAVEAHDFSKFYTGEAAEPLCDTCGAKATDVIDVWDSQGAKADSYAGGDGSKENPYIIRTVEQLFKMVRDEGVMRNADGNKIGKDGNVIDDSNFTDEVAAYYKVDDAITALYINDTRGYESQADFETAAANGELKNWSGDLTTDTRCSDCNTIGAGTIGHYCSWAYNYSFAGNFDGNGVTIYGLYSKLTTANTYEPGIGFFPGLSGNVVVKNIVFDRSYIDSPSKYAAVLTSSFGYVYNAKGYCNPHRMYADADVTIMNIAVRNAYVSGVGVSDYGYSAGIVASFTTAEAGLNISNCLFDGSTSTLVTTGANQYCAGILATGTYANTLTLSNCVSIDADVAFTDCERTDGSNIFVYNNYASGITESYYANSTVKSKYANYLSRYTTQNLSYDNAVLIATDYTTMLGMPLLNWLYWDIDAVDTYGTPMPTVNSEWEVKANNYYKQLFKESAASYDDGFETGVFSDYDELIGAGTQDDPYIISDALTLFKIIASGGTNNGISQYYKLGCDIDLGGMQWVDDVDWTQEYTDETTGTTGTAIYYIYKEFAGTLDGDGHTITGLYSTNVEKSVGFIPVLASGGVVKNLHIRDSYAASGTGYAGALVGEAQSGSTVTGCSVEDTIVISNGTNNDYHMLGSFVDGISNLYYIADENSTTTNKTMYVNASSNVYTDAAYITVDYGIDTENPVWYKGGADGSMPQLVNRADAMPYADADGDGEGYEYTSRDLAALKSKLLRASDYANIYGDVSRNGKTDIRDMVILQREILAQTDADEWEALDGFWRNIKNGKFAIYFDDNDNYDFARKLELYLEEQVPTVDIKKYAGSNVSANLYTGVEKGTADGEFDINLVTDTTLGNTYAVSYDEASAVLTIKGGTFTAVEQAVLDFIEGSNSVESVVYTTQEAVAIDGYKNPINVYTYSTSNDNGSLTNTSSTIGQGTYYYVWGDEFDSPVTDASDNPTVSYDNWFIRNFGYDETGGTGDTAYYNIKMANSDMLPKLNVVANGKLTIHRGVSSVLGSISGQNTRVSGVTFDSNDVASAGLLTSRNSLLFKRGYMEMQAILPNDGYAFPAWWLYTSISGTSNAALSRSLYSKVYELNDEAYDETKANFDPTDYTSYKYKLPTSFYEVDIFEIINRSGTQSGMLYYNIHKWYSNAMHFNDDGSYQVYELTWDAPTKFGTSANLLLDSTNIGSDGSYDANNFRFNIENAQSSRQVNAAINEWGTQNGVSQTYGKADGGNLEWWQILLGQTSTNYDVNMISNIGTANTVTEYRYGFLWDKDEMSFIIKDTSDNLISSVTVKVEDLKFDGASYTTEQYAHFLIDNAFWNESNVNPTSNDCAMEIAYVRLYQLDGQRDIVTPETEAFNSNNRLGN